MANPVEVISGISASADFTPAAASYGAGDVMDVAKEFAWTYANGLAIPSGSMIRVLTSVLKINITAVPSGQTSYGLRNSSVPQPSAQADNAVWALAAVDLASSRGLIPLGTPALPSATSAALEIKTQYQDFDIKLVGNTHWARLVTDGAHTAAAVARQVILYGILI